MDRVAQQLKQHLALLPPSAWSLSCRIGSYVSLFIVCLSCFSTHYPAGTPTLCQLAVQGAANPANPTRLLSFVWKLGKHVARVVLPVWSVALTSTWFKYRYVS